MRYFEFIPAELHCVVTEPVVEINKISKGFLQGDQWESLFDDFSLSIARGEFLAITGDSGCGKTTLLNMIGGLDQPDKGAVLVNKVAISKLSAAKRARFLNKNIGFIFQLHHLLPEESATGNVMLPLRIGGWPKAKARVRAMELLEKLMLGHRIDASPASMSGGERQRVAIARALATEPNVLLADEPTGSLHPKYKEEVFKALRELSRSEGVTVVMVTHDLNLIRDANGLRVDRQIHLENKSDSGRQQEAVT